MRGLSLALAIGILVATGGTVLAAADHAAFQTPSGSIGCAYEGSYLRCDVAGGVRPLPPRAKDCSLDWGQGFEMGRTGRATVVCAGDTALGAGPALRHTAWRRGGFACTYDPGGLTCTNASGHGFFLSTSRSYRF